MSLKEKIDVLKANTAKQAPAEALEVMHRAIETLKNSGIMEGILKTGDKIPQFELKSAEGVMVNSADILKNGPMILTFYRGAWWPYCNLELEALQQAVDEITALGATLVAVSPQIGKFNRAFIKKHQLNFDILSDPGNTLSNKFGLTWDFPDDLRQVYTSFGIDLERFNSDGNWRLPMPARYVVGQDSVIRSTDVNPDHTIRPEPDETVEFLRNMN